VKLLKIFPFKYWVTMRTCIIGSIQAMILGLCLDIQKSTWRLGWDLQLVTIFHSISLGVVVTVAKFCLLSWVIAKRGPIYPSILNLLSLIFVAMDREKGNPNLIQI
ncbi:hypothetical protein CISIN_1g036140mg, partial [Citrus sinensis]